MLHKEFPIDDLPWLSFSAPFAGVLAGLVLCTTLIAMGGGIGASRAAILAGVAAFVLCLGAAMAIAGFLPKGKVVIEGETLVAERLILANRSLSLTDIEATVRLWERSGIYPIGIVLSLDDGHQRLNIGLSGIALHEQWNPTGASSTAMFTDVRLAEQHSAELLRILGAHGVQIAARGT